MAFAAREQSGGTEKPTCDTGKYGLDEAGCYEIIGYPASWGSGGRGPVVAEDGEDASAVDVQAEVLDGGASRQLLPASTQLLPIQTLQQFLECDPRQHRSQFWGFRLSKFKDS